MYPLFLIPFFRRRITGEQPNPTIFVLHCLFRQAGGKEIIMKTQDKRETYKLFDDKGKFVTEYKLGEDGGLRLTSSICINGMTTKVTLMQRKTNCLSGISPSMTDGKEQFITDFREQFGREPFAGEIHSKHRTLEFLDGQNDSSDDDLGGSNGVLDITWTERRIGKATRDKRRENGKMSRIKMLLDIIKDAFSLENSLQALANAIAKDKDSIDKMNGFEYEKVSVYQARTLPEFDVFLSHANVDKQNIVDELNNSLEKLGVKIFYDKKSLEWGDKWKERILEGTKKSEFAIIVISKNFFDREWTEKELNEFLNQQNRNGQKFILPIVHNITVDDLKRKYPSISEIQAIDSNDYTCDEITLLFARQFIKRLKGVD